MRRINYEKMINTVCETSMPLINYVKSHPFQTVICLYSAGVTVDDLFQRFSRKKQTDEYTQNHLKFKQCLCKHEAVINEIVDVNNQLFNENCKYKEINNHLVSALILASEK